MNNTILQTQGLTKHYGSLVALNQCDLTIQKGQIWGILGPNGSGKSTLLSTILDALRPSAGAYSWFGNQEITDAKHRIGSLIEGPQFYPYLNAVDNLKIIASIKCTPDDQIPQILQQVGLYERRHSLFKTFSMGMKQRLAIAATLIGDPEVLILDEPTNGLDPEGIAEMRNLIIDLHRTGKTIVMASHILDEVEKVCSHVAVLKRGQLLAAGEVGNLLKPRKRIVLRSSHEAMKDMLLTYSGVHDLHTDTQGEEYTFEVDMDFSLETLCSYLQERGILLTGVKESKISLEEEFLQITKNSKI